MSKRKKTVKRGKRLAMSAFAVTQAADGYETEPLYQRKFGDGDIKWLVDEYRKQSSSDPSLTLEEFAIKYVISVDELRAYLPELSGEMGYCIVVWHGTSQSRAESILKEGFRPKVKKGEKRRIFFTQNPAVARRYARSRSKGESDDPAVIQCSINLNEYDDYELRGEGIFAFKAECISSEVIRRVVGRKKQQREKPEKRKNTSAELTDVAITFNAGRAAIAYWMNSYLKPDSAHKINEDHEAVEEIKRWFDAQMEEGEFGQVPDAEMQKQVKKHLPSLATL